VHGKSMGCEQVFVQEERGERGEGVKDRVMETMKGGEGVGKRS